MLRLFSAPPPTQSFDGKRDVTEPVPPKDLIAISRFLADRNVFGAVWTDAELKAVQRFGDMVDFIPLGKPITESVLPLMGFDDQISGLRRRPNRSVTIPNVLLDSADRNGLRINVVVYWMPDERRFLLIISRAVSRTDLEVELTAQVRARAIAEADVTAKSRIIARANEELTRANQDLQEFASVISHDLRSPLRRLRYFAGDAATSVAAGDLDHVSSNLVDLQRQAKRMSAMLTGLLEYSRIGRKSEAIEVVDTAALVQEVVESIERPPGLQIVIEGHWPIFSTLAQPLDIVLRNLIDNAVKHHDLADGQIIVHAEDANDMWVFSVADDGPGIPSDWHDAIFEPFKRIADEDAAPEGSGIGLALVKKMVEWFGGRIEIRSDPSANRGTTFRVHWPKTVTT